jgi:hypothetical protein
MAVASFTSAEGAIDLADAFGSGRYAPASASESGSVPLDTHPRLRLWMQWIHRTAMAIEVNSLASKAIRVEANVQQERAALLNALAGA